MLSVLDPGVPHRSLVRRLLPRQPACGLRLRVARQFGLGVAATELAGRLLGFRDV